VATRGNIANLHLAVHPAGKGDSTTCKTVRVENLGPSETDIKVRDNTGVSDYRIPKGQYRLFTCNIDTVQGRSFGGTTVLLQAY
jgi:hypothetical protein